MTKDDLHYLGAAEALAGFAARTLSPVELMEATIARIEAVDSAVNALPIRFFETALADARRAETRYSGKGAAPRALEGIPVAVKDELEVAGQPCTDGSLVFKDYVPETTAASAQRIIDAGAIIHARSATPEFCCAAVTESRLWGVTRNPWNLRHSPGGSSGGSGAALAAGMATLATGSDIGGSIRIPASFCGVVGFKPPYGRVPQMSPFNLDHYCHEGPMARSVEDCRLLENVMAGPDATDIASVTPKLTIPTELPSIEGWKIALSIELGGYDVRNDVAAAVRGAADTLRDLGADVEEIELGWSRDDMIAAARGHFAALFGSWVGGILRDHRDLLTDYAIEFAEGAVSGTAMSLIDTFAIEGEIYSHLARVLHRHRLLICPTFTIPALTAAAPYELDVVFRDALTLPFNICSRCPVIVVPAGRSADDVPVGLQIVGQTFDDVSVFAAAATLERQGPWYAGPESRPDLEGGMS